MNRRSFLGSSILLAAPRIAMAQTTNILKYVPSVDLAITDPLGNLAVVTRNHALMVADTLYGRDSNLEPQYQMLEGALVEDDGLTWRLTLRKGLRFHDNEPVRARDAVASLRRWATLDIYGRALFETVDELSAADDLTIVFKLKQPFPRLPYALSKLSVMTPVIVPERLATVGSSRPTEVIGSGPFRFKIDEYLSGARAVYERFDGYLPRSTGTPSLTAGPKIAKINRVEWHTIPDSSSAAEALQVGEVDWVEEALPDLLPLLRRNPAITIGAADALGTMTCLYVNHLYPPFNNPDVRVAVLQALDQSDFMTAVMGSDTTLWRDKVGMFCPNTPMANDAGMDIITKPRDLDQARRTIEKAGYKGQKIVLLQPGDLQSVATLGDVGADLLKQLGFHVDVQTTDWSTVLQRRVKQLPPDQGGWNVTPNAAPGLGTIDPAVHLWIRGNGKDAPIGWMTSPRMEALRTEWFNTTDSARAKEIAQEMQMQGWKDVPYLPTGQYFAQTAYRRNVKRLVTTMSVFWGVEKT